MAEELGTPPSASDIAALVAVLAVAMDRYIKNRARRTIVENAKVDPAKPKCKWVVEADACDFCKTRGSFWFNPAEMPMESHGGCKCYTDTVFATIKEKLIALHSSVEDPRVRRYLKSDKQPKNIIHAKYLQHSRDSLLYAHIAKRNKHPSSYLTITEEECEMLVNKYAGSGELSYNSKWRRLNDKNITEVITVHDSVVGVVVNNETGVAVETSVFKIHYSGKGAHIVPDYPSKAKRNQRERNRSR